ncbi:DUF418 domain-containing protein [Nocardioides sp.]|uniref:DUF418 domain-containing protein n=1 Tax=Nocardioides sp. TaxID=35761 RepID=UPI002736725C|nr:DUF418 domain-containing protein [Nocardioides sp.]MDP3891244.1 DUF418 domain-containing protein [Nocardioides sp.]
MDQRTPGAREIAPDVARGLALALIAVANSMLYLHGRPYGVRQHLSDQQGVDAWVSLVSVAAVEGRIYPLFGLLLGYGIAMTARGASRAVYRVRLRGRGLALLAFGAVHATLLFSGEVLGLYGLLTLLIIPVLAMPSRRLLGLAAVSLLVLSVPQALSYAEVGPTHQRSVLWSIGIEDPWLALLWRGPEWLMTIIGMSSVVSAVLVGVWWCRFRHDSPPGERGPMLARVAALGAGIGLVGGVPAALAAGGFWHIEDTSTAQAVLYLHTVTGLVGGIGYAAGVAWWCQRPRFRVTRGVRLLRSVGQRSLTCYLLQSVGMVVVLPAWTLGIGGRLGPAGAAGFGLAVYAGTAVIVVLLGSRGRRPAETALRRLASRWGRERATTSPPLPQGATMDP